MADKSAIVHNLPIKHDADEIKYDNTASGLSATDIKSAIDEIAGASTGTMNAVKSNDVQVGGSDITTLDFSSEFTVGESPDTEINISLNYANIALSSLSGTLDISAQSNLVVSPPVTLTGDTVGFDFSTNNTWTGTNDFESNMSLGTNSKFTFDDSATIAPLNITERAAAPSSPASGDIYLDDGTNTGSGNPGWRRYTGAVWEDITAASSSGSPGGSNTQIQYNNSGAFGGISTVTWDGSTFQIASDLKSYRSDAATDGQFFIEQGSTGDASIDWLLTAGQTYRAYIDNSDNDSFKIDDVTGAVTIFDFDQSTNILTLGVAGDIILGDGTLRVLYPQTDGAIDLGKSANRFNDVFLQGDVDMENCNFIFGTTTGTQIGTATTQKLAFYGTTPVVQPSAYTPTNVTTDRTYDANSTSTDELADVLGTLIADLQSLGLIG